ncbi:MAG: hypothetical protein RRB12_11700 [Armatimonadota bacterium]|nr:hypothetical protein [Armatimonadota bacterium]
MKAMRQEIPLWLGVVIIVAFVLVVGFFVWRYAGQKQIVPASEVLGGPQKARQFQQRPGGPAGPRGMTGTPINQPPQGQQKTK